MVRYENRYGKGLTPVDRKNPDNLRTPLQVGLSALADIPGIVDNFHNVLIDFVVQGNYAQELNGIFEFGIAASHVTKAPHQVIEHGYETLEIDVYAPLGSGDNSNGAPKAESSKATLLAITGARNDPKSSEVILEGLAISAGLEININDTVIVFLDPKTGRSELDPRFTQTWLRTTTSSL